MADTYNRTDPLPDEAKLGQGFRRWSCPQYLAVVGLPILVWEGWTLLAWLWDGPHQITAFRSTGSLNWYAALIYEGASLILALVVGTWVIHGCIRARTLTFDAMFCIAGATMWWGTGGPNFFMPTFLTSSNFVNVNSACGNIPFVVNRHCGRSPDPIIFTLALYSFGVLAAALLAGRVAQRVRARWPHISNLRVLFALCVLGLVVHAAFAIPSVALGIWVYVAPKWTYVPLGGWRRYPIEAAIGGGAVWFGLLGAIRVFRDESDRTFLERGLDHLSPWKRKVVTFLALYACMQLVLVAANGAVAAYGPYEQTWPHLPAYLVNGVCDAPGVQGTRYGPCPGTP